MSLETLYKEIENFKAGGTLSSEELTDLHKKREAYKSRKIVRMFSGIIYLSILIFLLLAFFYGPVRSFVVSYLNLGDSFWKIRGVVFLAALIANYFLCFWRAPFVGEAIGEAIILSLFSLGIVITPYLVLLGLLLAFFIRLGFDEIDVEIKKVEAKRMKEIYNIALKENDMKLMQLLAEIQYKEAETYILKKEEEEEERKRKEAAQQEEARRQQEELRQKQEKLVKDQLDGQKMYEEAIASDPVDEDLMKKAAKLGCVSACYYLGKKLLSDWASDMYTAEEKEEIAEEAAKYFDVARQIATLGKLDIKTECQFLWLLSRLQYEGNTKSGWKEMLNAFREIQKSGDLPEEHNEALELAIKQVIKTIDGMDNQSNTEPIYNGKPVQEMYCKFRNGAICTKNSDSFTIRHCNYVDDPGKCLTCIESHGLGFR